MLVGTNTRYEAPLLNTRIRKTIIANDARVALVGEKVDLSYEYDYLGDSTQVLEDLLGGKHKYSSVSYFMNCYFELLSRYYLEFHAIISQRCNIRQDDQCEFIG